MKIKDIKVQIALRVREVATRDRYGVDKRFVEKINPGDIIMISGNLLDSLDGYTTGKSWEVINTTNGTSKTFSSSNSVRHIFDRVTEWEQINLI